MRIRAATIAGMPRSTVNILRTVPLRALAVVLMLAVLPACTPHAALIGALVPDGAVSTLLGNMKGMEEGNQKRVAELEAKQDWDGLAKFADENLAKDKNSADWWLVAGYAHSRAGRHQRAVDCLSERVRLAPDDMLGWNMLAQSYRDAKQPQRAVQTLNNAHLVRKGTDASWFLLGECYSDLNRDLPAAAAYREAVQLNERMADAWFGLGRASARLGRMADYESALGALNGLDATLAKQLAELRPRPRKN